MIGPFFEVIECIKLEKKLGILLEQLAECQTPNCQRGRYLLNGQLPRVKLSSLDFGPIVRHDWQVMTIGID